MSPSCMMLKSPTWILPARSGSSLSAKMPRFARGSSPKWMVSSSARTWPPRGARVGVDLAPREDRDLRIEERDELADDPALGLAAQTEQNEVLAGEQRVHDL